MGDIKPTAVNEADSVQVLGIVKKKNKRTSKGRATELEKLNKNVCIKRYNVHRPTEVSEEKYKEKDIKPGSYVIHGNVKIYIIEKTKSLLAKREKRKKKHNISIQDFASSINKHINTQDFASSNS